MEKQQTLKKSFSLEGVGLHTGNTCKMVVRPAEEDTGYLFKRTDLEGTPTVPALADYVTHTNRGTVLEKGNAIINTPEHLLAACYGMSLDNVLIEIDGPEIPILDGSSMRFVDAIEKAGIVEQEATRDYLVINEELKLTDQQGSSISIYPSKEFSIACHISFASEVLKNQYAFMPSLRLFKSQFANCRTFVFLRELEQLFNTNLIQGGSLDNAIVIQDSAMSEESLEKLKKMFNNPTVKFTGEGILNNINLHFDNEPARHKLLDILGDLALTGKFIKGYVTAYKPGHKINCQFANKLRKTLTTSPPYYNPSEPPLYDTLKIKQLLPHRYPFLLIDKVISRNDSEIVAVKNVTNNELFFQGHFPDEPIMPGVLLVEACAQAGGLFVLSNVDDPENYSTYFLKIENAKFRKKVVPGDVLVFKVTLLSPIRRGTAELKGTVFVGDNIVSEVNLLAQIVKNTNL